MEGRSKHSNQTKSQSGPSRQRYQNAPVAPSAIAVTDYREAPNNHRDAPETGDRRNLRILETRLHGRELRDDHRDASRANEDGGSHQRRHMRLRGFRASEVWFGAASGLPKPSDTAGIADGKWRVFNHRSRVRPDARDHGPPIAGTEAGMQRRRGRGAYAPRAPHPDRRQTDRRLEAPIHDVPAALTTCVDLPRLGSLS